MAAPEPVIAGGLATSALLAQLLISNIDLGEIQKSEMLQERPRRCLVAKVVIESRFVITLEFTLTAWPRMHSFSGYRPRSSRLLEFTRHLINRSQQIAP